MRIRPDIKRHWWALLLLAALVIFARNALVVYPGEGGYPPVSLDGVRYQYAGWSMVQGRMPYSDLWVVKPPVSVEVPALVALVTGSNMRFHHTLIVILTVITVTGCAWLVGKIVYDMTGDGRAALIAGLCLLTFTMFTQMALLGYRPKYITLFFGLLAILLARRDRLFWAGASLVVAAGSWQPGIFFVPVVGVNMLLRGLTWKRLARVCAGGAFLTLIAVLPVALDGGLDLMVEQVMDAPLDTSQSNNGQGQHLFMSLMKITDLTRFSLLVWILGFYGLLFALVTLQRERLELIAGAALFSLQVFVIDFDSVPDLFVLMAFASMGVGLLMADINAGTLARFRGRAMLLALGALGLMALRVVLLRVVSSKPIDTTLAVMLLPAIMLVAIVISSQRPHVLRRGLALLLLVALFLNVGLLGVDGVTYKDPLRYPPMDPLIESDPDRFGLPSLTYMYWYRVVPPGCHYRLGSEERAYMEREGRTIYDSCR